MSVDWDLTSFIAASGYRERVLGHLVENGPTTPSTIADDTDVSLTHVSRTLGEMREENLVELLVSEDTVKGRIYDVTDDGRDVFEHVEEVGGAL